MEEVIYNFNVNEAFVGSPCTNNTFFKLSNYAHFLLVKSTEL